MCLYQESQHPLNVVLWLLKPLMTLSVWLDCYSVLFYTVHVYSSCLFRFIVGFCSPSINPYNSSTTMHEVSSCPFDISDFVKIVCPIVFTSYYSLRVFIEYTYIYLMRRSAWKLILANWECRVARRLNLFIWTSCSIIVKWKPRSSKMTAQPVEL